MKKVIKKKLIIIPHKGLIHPIGSSGPHLVPYYEDVEVINKLIMGNYKVTEILKDGTEVPLDYMNYDKENGDPDNPSMIVTYETARNSKQKRKLKDSRVITVDDNGEKKSEIQELLIDSTKKVAKNVNTENSAIKELVHAEKVQVSNDNKNHKNSKYERRQKFINREIDSYESK